MARTFLALRLAAGLLAGLAVAACIALTVVTHGLGLQPVAVYSGSMAPKIAVGGLVLERVVPSSSIRVGDVVTFADPFDPHKVVTHRIVRILHARDGQVGYRTKGDANPTRDPWTLKFPPRVGKVVASVPLAGYALVYAQTREVRAALIALAALSVLLSLLRRIWFPPSKRCAPAS